MNEQTYYEQHRFCPSCGSDGITQKTAGYLGDEDYNAAGCDCGWRGVVHDLIAVKVPDNKPPAQTADVDEVRQVLAELVALVREAMKPPAIEAKWDNSQVDIPAAIRQLRERAIQGDVGRGRLAAGQFQQPSGMLPGLPGAFYYPTPEEYSASVEQQGGSGSGGGGAFADAYGVGEQAQQGAIFTMPVAQPLFAARQATVIWDTLAELHALLGLSATERGFLQDAGTAALTRDLPEVYDVLSVYTDWLDEQMGREKDGVTIRSMTPQTGDVVVLTYQPIGTLSSDVTKLVRGLENWCGGMGRPVHFVALAEGQALQRLDEPTMRRLGWMRTSQYLGAWGDLANELTGEPEDIIGAQGPEQMLKMIRRLKVENIALRQQVADTAREEREACAGLAEDCSAFGRDIAEEIRSREGTGLPADDPVASAIRAVREARDAMQSRRTAACGMPHHAPNCDCQGFGGAR